MGFAPRRKEGMMNRMLYRVLLSLLTLFLTGCDSGFTKLGASDYGVVFSAMPRFVGGGLAGKVLEPGEMEFIWPWETVYRFDTSRQTIGWGGIGEGGTPGQIDYVETRTSDGNEVGLAISVQYHIDPKRIPYILQNVAVDDGGVRRLVEAISRADIRTHMNVLRTRDYFKPERTQTAIDCVEAALASRLEREGIIIDDVVYKDHRFERRFPDGRVDQSFQDQIDRTQAVKQQREQELKRVKTVVEKKKQELNEEQARYNRLINEAKGYKQQAMFRGDAHFKAKQNESEQIRAKGMAEVEGLKKQIEALSGPGGEALLRLALVRELLGSNPGFVIYNSSGEANLGLDIKRIDAGELLRAAGIAGIASEISQLPASPPPPPAEPLLPGVSLTPGVSTD